LNDSIPIVRQFGELVKRAEGRTIEGIQEGRIEEEDSVTDRFLNEMEHVFEEQGQRGGIQFRARKLQGRGKDSPEKLYGADLCGVLNIDVPNLQQSKGFLSQAKMEGRGISARVGFPTRVAFPSSDQHLSEQVGKMLDITPDSFVIVYSDSGFVVVPASSVQGLKHTDNLYGKPVKLFFQEFLMCFIGDPHLNGWSNAKLEELRERTSYRRAMVIDVKKSDMAR